MKLIKTMLAGMVLLVFATGQEQTDGGPPPPPPCDPNATYPVADPGPDGGCGNYNDCNGNGAYDLGEPCGDPVPFEDVDANSDGVVDREEGRAQYGYDPNFDQQFDEADTNGDGVVDHPEYDAAVQAAGGPGPGGPGPGGPGPGGPPSCYDMDMNGDGVIDREEARDKFGDDPNFDQRYDEVDTNGDGVVDCAEHDTAVAQGPDGGPPGGPGPGGSDPVWEAFASTLANGGSPDDAFNAIAAAVYDMEVVTGNMTDEEFAQGEADARAAFDQALADGKSPEEAFGAAMSAAGPPAPTNHWDGNCAAMMSGQDEYWLDSDGDGSPEDGPYAVWYEDADGNPVNCGPGPGDGEGDGYDQGGDGYDQSGDGYDTGGDGYDTGGPKPGGGPREHLRNTLKEGMDSGVFDDNDRQYIKGKIDELRQAVADEHSEAGCDNCAGDVMQSVDEWAQGLRDEGNHMWADRIMTDLCHIEFAMHKSLDPQMGGDEGPMCGPGPDDGNQN